MERIIDTNLAPEKYSIELSSAKFKKSYAIYIIELTHKDSKYYFIDNLLEMKGISTKFSFEKLAQLFEEIKSANNNEIFKFILNKILKQNVLPTQKIADKHKFLVEQFLNKSNLKMTVYPLLQFNFLEIKKKEHKVNSKKTKIFEQQVIRLFKMNSMALINETEVETYVRYDDIPFLKVWHQIKDDFNL